MIALLLSSLRAASSASAAEAKAGPTGPHLEVAEPVHDFGTVQRGDTLQYNLKVSNTGNETLTISEVVPSCGCTTTGDWTHSLKPGESGVIPIKIDTAEFSGSVIKSVTLKSNDSANPEAVVHMQAIIWTPIKLSNNVIVFPALTDPDEATSRSITIDNGVEQALTLSNIESDNPHFKPELRVITPGKQFELKVTTVPPLAEGTQTGRIHLKSSNPKMPDVSVQTVVTVLPAVQIAPNQIPLPSGKLTAPEKRFAFVSVHRGAAPELSDVQTNAPGVEITTTRAMTGKQITLTLTFPAGFMIGPNDKFYVRGKTNQPTAPNFEIPIVGAAE
jgi:hypothetical protein